MLSIQTNKIFFSPRIHILISVIRLSCVYYLYLYLLANNQNLVLQPILGDQKMAIRYKSIHEQLCSNLFFLQTKLSHIGRNKLDHFNLVSMPI